MSPKALSIVDRDTSHGTSSVVLAKGSSDRYAVAMGVQVLDHLGHEGVILHSDAEPAAVNVARAIAQIFQRTSNFDGGAKRLLQEQWDSGTFSSVNAGIGSHSEM